MRAGWNIAGMSAWILSSLLALLTVNIPDHFVGWLGNLAKGVDISLLVALVMPAILYPLFFKMFPEPRAIFGPAGPRWIGAADLLISPIEGESKG